MAGMQPTRDPDGKWTYPSSKDVLKAVELKTIAHYIGVRRETIARLLSTDPFLHSAGMEEGREALRVARFGGSSLCHLTTWGPYTRGTKRTKVETIFRWASNLFGWTIVW